MPVCRMGLPPQNINDPSRMAEDLPDLPQRSSQLTGSHLTVLERKLSQNNLGLGKRVNQYQAVAIRDCVHPVGLPKFPGQ